MSYQIPANTSPTPSAPPMASSSLYPSIDTSDLAVDLFQESSSSGDDHSRSKCPPPTQETIFRMPGAILHLIDAQQSVELAYGELTVLRLVQGDSPIAVLASVGGAVQWPITRDGAAVKLDDSHYFFTLRVPPGEDSGNSIETLNYGLTLISKGQEIELNYFDSILGTYSNFSVQKLTQTQYEGSELLDNSTFNVTPEKVLEGGLEKDAMERNSAAYWTTLAPNVEEYSGSVARAIAAGSGQLVRGILWCGDVTVERIKWGNEFLKKRVGPAGKQADVSPETLKRIKRVKKVTKMSEKVATGILSGVVKVSGFVTSSVANSKAGKKFFSLLPGEIVLASLDGFGKLCDAVEVAGKNVLSTSSTVTTGLVSHRYGDKAGEATNEGLGAAGHAVGTAWAVFKIRKALDPKSSLKPSKFAKSALKAGSAELKANKKSSQ